MATPSPAGPAPGSASRRLAAVEALAGAMARDLQAAVKEGGPALREAAARNAERAAQLAKLAAGGRLHEQQTTLALVWPRVQERLATRLKHNTVRATIPADLPPATGSGEAWVEILTELVANSLEAMPSGGVLDVRAAAPRPRWLQISVEDSGHGITAESLPHVFEPFYTSRGSSDGLGLAMVASWIESLGGSISIASKPDLGTRVEMEVPAARSASATPSFKGTLLVADDDVDVRNAIAGLLRSFGLEVVLCDSGTVAKSLLTAEPERFRAAVLDIVMPGTPVGEVVQAVRQRAPELPVLLVSGYDTMSMVDGVLSTGGVRFLRKPFTREELFRALEDLFTAAR